MVVAAGFDGEMDGNFVEERGGRAVGAEVVADGELELVSAGCCVREERGIAASVVIGEDVGEELAAVEETDADVGGGVAGGGIEHMRGEFSHPCELSRWRAGMQGW